MMQSDGAGDMDMDELFDRHLEQNEGEGVDGFEEDDLAPSDGGHGGPYHNAATAGVCPPLGSRATILFLPLLRWGWFGCLYTSTSSQV